MNNIAYLGMGVMGAPMAINLVKSMPGVTVWNRTRDKTLLKEAGSAGCQVATTIQAAVEEADIIITCLSDVPDVEDVLFGKEGVAVSAKSDALIIDMSTIGRDAAVSIGQKLKENGLRFLDAPVSGGDIGAQRGTLTIMVGGSQQDYDAAHAIFQAMGKNIYYCGKQGSGQAVKMVNQALASVHMIALAEALSLAEALDVSGEQVVNICGSGAAASWALSNLGPEILDGNFAPGFMIKHMQKDIRLVSEAIEKAGLSLPGINLASELFSETASHIDQGETLGTQGIYLTYKQKNKI